MWCCTSSLVQHRSIRKVYGARRVWLERANYIICYSKKYQCKSIMQVKNSLCIPKLQISSASQSNLPQHWGPAKFAGILQISCVWTRCTLLLKKTDFIFTSTYLWNTKSLAFRIWEKPCILYLKLRLPGNNECWVFSDHCSGKWAPSSHVPISNSLDNTGSSVKELGVFWKTCFFLLPFP